MKRQTILIALLAIGTTAATAQETYENANLLGNDLNGTARYVGMGGAMEALGADISTMGTNPAGIGVFRKSQIIGSGGYVGQNGSFGSESKGTASLDQLGFVYAMPTGSSSFLNVGFNYHKSKNFKQILTAANSLNGASQNKLSAVKGVEGLFNINETSSGTWVGDDYSFSQVDYLYYNALLMNSETAEYTYYNASGYDFGRSNTGYIGSYDINISGNQGNRFYWGLTVSLDDVHYNSYSLYTEQLAGDAGQALGSVSLADSRSITGTGLGIKAGIIFRPVETSPFRIGLYVHTPTWYDLSTSNYTTLTNKATVGEYDNGHSNESYDFRLATPWKFGLSLGHTVGRNLALGLTYEYSDYGQTDTRVNDSDGDYYYDDYFYSASASDKAMNEHTKRTLQGVSTLKAGLEYKPAPNFALRLGYNYVAPMFASDGYKDGTLGSWGSYYSSTTDYTNWKATNRLTLGAGYSFGGWNFDVAYAYSHTSGQFSPFTSYTAAAGQSYLDNIATATDVKQERHQLIFTLGYRF